MEPISSEPTKRPHVNVFAEEAGIRYSLGRFEHNSDRPAILAIQAIQFIGANDQLALAMLQDAVAKLKARMWLLEMPVNSKWVM
jgi:hypothetical protein